MPGGSINLTCVAVGAPMPFVKWMKGDTELTKEEEMPIGRNVLELNNIRQSANYTCVAMSSLGMIETTAQIIVKGKSPFKMTEYYTVLPRRNRKFMLESKRHNILITIVQYHWNLDTNPLVKQVFPCMIANFSNSRKW